MVDKTNKIVTNYMKQEWKEVAKLRVSNNTSKPEIYSEKIKNPFCEQLCMTKILNIIPECWSPYWVEFGEGVVWGLRCSGRE